MKTKTKNLHLQVAMSVVYYTYKNTMHLLRKILVLNRRFPTVFENFPRIVRKTNERFPS